MSRRSVISLAIAVLLLVAWQVGLRTRPLPIETGSAAILQAFGDHASGLMVNAEGVVERVLSDDNQGSRHQRFILRIDEGLTVLMSHNIDLAQRVPIEVGDVVAFRGQYEWNAKGGVVHWTHRDPDGSHPEGWIEHRGQRFR